MTRPVWLDRALRVQEKVDDCVAFLLKKTEGGVGPRDLRHPPEKRRPKKKDSSG